MLYYWIVYNNLKIPDRILINTSNKKTIDLILKKSYKIKLSYDFDHYCISNIENYCDELIKILENKNYKKYCFLL